MEKRLETILGHLKPSVGLKGQPCASGLRYTIDGCILTAEQRLAYERDGFIVVPGLVGQDTLDMFKKRFKDICTQQVKVSEPLPIPLTSHTLAP